MIVVPSWLARPAMRVLFVVVPSCPLRPKIRVLVSGEADDLSRFRRGCEQLTCLPRLLSEFQVGKIASFMR